LRCLRERLPTPPKMPISLCVWQSKRSVRSSSRIWRCADPTLRSRSSKALSLAGSGPRSLLMSTWRSSSVGLWRTNRSLGGVASQTPAGRSIAPRTVGSTISPRVGCSTTPSRRSARCASTRTAYPNKHGSRVMVTVTAGGSTIWSCSASCNTTAPRRGSSTSPRTPSSPCGTCRKRLDYYGLVIGVALDNARHLTREDDITAPFGDLLDVADGRMTKWKPGLVLTRSVRHGAC
jgi:hypothetical protein